MIYNSSMQLDISNPPKCGKESKLHEKLFWEKVGFEVRDLLNSNQNWKLTVNTTYEWVVQVVLGQFYFTDHTIYDSTVELTAIHIFFYFLSWVNGLCIEYIIHSFSLISLTSKIKLSNNFLNQFIFSLGIKSTQTVTMKVSLEQLTLTW